MGSYAVPRGSARRLPRRRGWAASVGPALLPWAGPAARAGAADLRTRMGAGFGHAQAAGPLPAAVHHRLGPEPLLPAGQRWTSWAGRPASPACRRWWWPACSLATPRVLGVVIWARAAAGAVGTAQPARFARRPRHPRAQGRAAHGRVDGCGHGTPPHQAFVLAALLAAVSGWLYAHLQRFVNPTPFNLNIGIELLFMAVVGGAGHLWGAVLGAALLTLLKEKLQDVLPCAARQQRQLRGDRVRPADALCAAALRRWPVAHAGAHRAAAGCARMTRRARPPPQRPRRTLPCSSRNAPARRGEVLLQASNVSKRFGGLVANNRSR